MPGFVQRVGDRNEAGGVILNGDSSVLVNGRPVAVLGATVSPHPCCGAPNRPECVVHCAAKTTTKNFKVLVGGKPICTTGDLDTCDHPRVGGSSDVIVG